MAKPIQPIIKPQRLKPGDVIGIAAPAGPYDKDEFENGITAIRDLQFQVKIPPDLQKPVGFLAASDNHRAKLLMDLFKDPEVDAIVCARGGYGSLRILDNLDYGLIQNHPKVFVGFSDISALHTALVMQAGLTVFHGPGVTSLARSGEKTRATLFQTLTTDQPIEVRPDNPIPICAGQATGMLTGGNLATLCHLLGTPFAPIYKDGIVLLEDTAEAPYKIDRMLFQMKMAGCFEGVKGAILGRFQDSGNYQDICDLVGAIFEDMQVPILAGFEIGHNGCNMTIPLGIPATLDTEQGSLIFQETATS